MIGQEEFARFAAEHDISFETGLPQRLDRCGNAYVSLVAGADNFDTELLKLLGGDKYVIVRIYPHYNDEGMQDLIRMRFSSYREKPA